MMNIDSADLELLVNQGEKSISDEIFFLKDRYSIPAQVSVAEYVLPDYVNSITRVTWLGYKLDPMPKRYQSEIFQDSKQYGRPYWYVYDTLGIRKISLFPIPNQTLPVVADPWNGLNISRGAICEFWRISDNVNFTLPHYNRRQLLRYYLAQKTYQREGRGNKLALWKYYSARWAIEKTRFADFLDSVNTRPRGIVVPQGGYGRTLPHDPMLPIDRFGTSE